MNVRISSLEVVDTRPDGKTTLLCGKEKWSGKYTRATRLEAEVPYTGIHTASPYDPKQWGRRFEFGDTFVDILTLGGAVMTGTGMMFLVSAIEESERDPSVSLVTPIIRCAYSASIGGYVDGTLPWRGYTLMWGGASNISYESGPGRVHAGFVWGFQVNGRTPDPELNISTVLCMPCGSHPAGALSGLCVLDNDVIKKNSG